LGWTGPDFICAYQLPDYKPHRRCLRRRQPVAKQAEMTPIRPAVMYRTTTATQTTINNPAMNQKTISAGTQYDPYKA
jgi:hypothetical protein